MYHAFTITAEKPRYHSHKESYLQKPYVGKILFKRNPYYATHVFAKLTIPFLIHSELDTFIISLDIKNSL